MELTRVSMSVKGALLNEIIVYQMVVLLGSSKWCLR